MEERVEYWSKRWQAEDAPWHKSEVNEFLESYFDQAFKIKEGHEVVGLDGVEKPILEFFKEQGLPYTKGNEGGLPFYVSADGHLKIYHCDLFALNPEICGKFDGIWDHGSIIAIIAVEREKYAELIKNLLNETFGFLIDTVQYQQSQFQGPPLSVSVEEVKHLFGDTCEVETLLTLDTNADPTSPTSSKIRWNIDECYEIILLLKAKVL